LGTTGSADGLDSSQDENVFEFEENDSSCDEMKAKGSRKHSKRRMGSSPRASQDLKDSLSDIVNFDTDEPCTVWMGTEDGWYVLLRDINLRDGWISASHANSVYIVKQMVTILYVRFSFLLSQPKTEDKSKQIS